MINGGRISFAQKKMLVRDFSSEFGVRMGQEISVDL